MIQFSTSTLLWIIAGSAAVASVLFQVGIVTGRLMLRVENLEQRMSKVEKEISNHYTKLANALNIDGVV